MVASYSGSKEILLKGMLSMYVCEWWMMGGGIDRIHRDAFRKLNQLKAEPRLNRPDGPGKDNGRSC